jgi:iron(III) transport system substrate-binding protein
MEQIRSLLSLGCLLVVLISLGWAEVFAQAGGQASVIEGAKKEGKVVWYAALLRRFEQKYPFIKTELLRAGSEQLLNRILTEDSANRSSLDLVNITTINALKRRGLLQVHRSQEFQAYPPQFKDADDYWATVYNIYYVIGYNSKMVPARDAPRNWDDFLDPKWKGKIGMDQEEYEWYAATISLLGKRKSAKISSGFGQTRRPLEPGSYNDLATYGGG